MFDEQQKTNLAAPLSRAAVKGRKQGGRNVSYIEGWHVIAEANRIFGFDNWTRETLDLKCVAEVDRPIGEAKLPGFGVTYICKVRVTVGGVVREGCGSGHGIDRDVGLAHEAAIKESETDAMKRAFITFGNPFGLALYDKEQSNVVDEEVPTESAAEMEVRLRKRDDFLTGCRGTIASWKDQPEKLIAWWKSKEQMEGRRAYLSDGEMEVLKAELLAVLPPPPPAPPKEPPT